MDELDALLCAAIVASLGQRDSRHRVAGYALIVDADMTSIMGASVGFGEFAMDDPLFFSPVDWPSGYHSSEFRRVSERLSQVRNTAYEDRVVTMVASMKTALTRARALDDSLARALLLVSCADGGGVWESLEDEAAAELNEPTAYDRWRKARSVRAS